MKRDLERKENKCHRVGRRLKSVEKRDNITPLYEKIPPSKFFPTKFWTQIVVLAICLLLALDSRQKAPFFSHMSKEPKKQRRGFTDFKRQCFEFPNGGKTTTVPQTLCQTQHEHALFGHTVQQETAVPFLFLMKNKIFYF